MTKWIIDKIIYNYQKIVSIINYMCYNNIRYKNVLKIPEYYAKISDNIKPILEEEFIDSNEKEIYEYILGLRVIPDGIVPKGKYIDLCNKLVDDGFLIRDNLRYTLSSKGVLMANDVFDKFI